MTTPVDHFPETMSTLIQGYMDAGTIGRRELNHHIMSVYRRPLKIYFLGSSYRSLGDPDDLVQGFFASRLERQDYFEKWQESRLSLRRWLMNAFILYMKELCRAKSRIRSREQELNGLEERSLTSAELDRTWAEAVVREACAQTANRCRADGQQRHWEVFYRHHILGQPYREVAPEFDFTPAQAAVAARTVANKFRQSLRDFFASERVPDDAIDDDIRDLLGAIRPCP